MKLSFLYAVALKFFIIYSSLAFYLRGARDGEGNGLGWGGKGGGGGARQPHPQASRGLHRLFNLW